MLGELCIITKGPILTAVVVHSDVKIKSKKYLFSGMLSYLRYGETFSQLNKKCFGTNHLPCRNL